MRVGIDIDFNGNKNLNVNADGPDLRGDDHCVGAGVPRAVALLDQVYVDARAALLAHDKNPAHVPPPAAGTPEYWETIVLTYRAFLLDEMFGEAFTKPTGSTEPLDTWLLQMLEQELGDRKAMLKSITNYRNALKVVEEAVPALAATTTTEDWNQTLREAVAGKENSK